MHKRLVCDVHGVKKVVRILKDAIKGDPLSTWSKLVRRLEKMLSDDSFFCVFFHTNELCLFL